MEPIKPPNQVSFGDHLKPVQDPFAARRTAFQVALALTSYSALSCAAAVGGRCAVGYRSTQLRVRGKRAPVTWIDIWARNAWGDVIAVVFLSFIVSG